MWNILTNAHVSIKTNPDPSVDVCIVCASQHIALLDKINDSDLDLKIHLTNSVGSFYSDQNSVETVLYKRGVFDVA